MASAKKPPSPPKPSVEELQTANAQLEARLAVATQLIAQLRDENLAKEERIAQLNLVVASVQQSSVSSPPELKVVEGEGKETG